MAAAAYYLRSQYSKYVFIDSGSCNWCTQLSNRSRPIFCRITRLQRSISGNGSANIRNWGGKKEKKLLYFCFAYFLNFFFGFVQSLSQASQYLTHFITQTRSTFVFFRWIRKKTLFQITARQLNICTSGRGFDVVRQFYVIEKKHTHWRIHSFQKFTLNFV